MAVARNVWILITLALLLNCGCAHLFKIPPETVHAAYTAYDRQASLLYTHAPVFITYGYQHVCNRIGKPSARYDTEGHEQIYVDSFVPVIYYRQRRFSTARGNYTNLAYRVHFAQSPYSLIPFNLSAGQNVGLIVVITLNARNQPVLITTVHTCGCYLAMVPTSYLPASALPDGWQKEPLSVYGETLPSLLDYSAKKTPKLLVHLRPGVHRVFNLEVVEDTYLQGNAQLDIIRSQLIHVFELERIPIDSGVTSFYYQEGPLAGHVKGSLKPWETLLMSLFSLDFFVGTDKIYAETEKTGNPFYTSLKPWNRIKSDMSDFPRFLEFWGWKL